MKTFTIYKNSQVTLTLPRTIQLDAPDLDTAYEFAVGYIVEYGEVVSEHIDLEESD